MNNFLAFIFAQLTLVTPNVYQEQAPATAQFPYVVFTATAADEAEFREDITLDVDIWDQNTDTTGIENLADNIDKQLNRQKYLDVNLQASVYRESRITIPDDDPTIRHRQLRYQVKTYIFNILGI